MLNLILLPACYLRPMRHWKFYFKCLKLPSYLVILICVYFWHSNYFSKYFLAPWFWHFNIQLIGLYNFSKLLSHGLALHGYLKQIQVH